jgi:hypothetical protein
MKKNDVMRYSGTAKDEKKILKIFYHGHRSLNHAMPTIDDHSFIKISQISFDTVSHLLSARLFCENHAIGQVFG